MKRVNIHREGVGITTQLEAGHNWALIIGVVVFIIAFGTPFALFLLISSAGK